MKKWNSLAVAGIVVLLVLGYGIPSVIMAIEDNGRKSELKSFEIENIELDFQNVDLEEEMRIFPDMILNHIVMEMGDTSIEIKQDSQQNIQDDLQGNEDGIAQENVQEEIKNTNELRIETSLSEFLKVLHPEHNIEFVDLKATYYVMMVSQEDERVYPIWECYGIDKEKREYRFWLDDLSGKVLAFGISHEVIGITDEAFFEMIERLGKYYGYDVFGLAESMSNAYKTNAWENALLLLDKAGNLKNSPYLFKVGERLLFNVYPGTVSIYDGTYSESE